MECVLRLEWLRDAWQLLAIIEGATLFRFPEDLEPGADDGPLD